MPPTGQDLPANYFRSFFQQPPRPGHSDADAPAAAGIVNSQDLTCGLTIRPDGALRRGSGVTSCWSLFADVAPAGEMAAAVHDFADLRTASAEPRCATRPGRPCGTSATRCAICHLVFASSTILTRPRHDTAAEIAARGGIAHPMCSTCPTPRRSEAFAERVSAEHGPHIVVNNAGIGQAGRFDHPGAGYSTALAVNLGGVVNVALLGVWVERGLAAHRQRVADGRLCRRAQRVLHLQSGDLHVLSDRLRAELDAAGVGLTTICPGVIDTNIVATTGFHAPGTDEEDRDGRLGRSTDVCAAQLACRRDRVRGQEEEAIRPVAPEAWRALYRYLLVRQQALRHHARLRG